MLDQVSGTGMDPSFQIMFDFTEGTFKSFPIALGLSGPLEAQGVHSPHSEGILDKLSHGTSQPYFHLKPQLSLGRGEAV